MADVTVTQLAETIETPVDRLLQQMQEAGLPQKNPDDAVTEEEKQTLLAHRRQVHGDDDGDRKKITLKRRTLSTLKSSAGAGRGRTVNVEVRKKRTYVRRADADAAGAAAEPAQDKGPVKVEVNRSDEAEARRRQAHAEAEAEAERRRQEAAERKRKEEQEAAEKKRKEEQEAARQAETERESEEKVSARKDKRDRHDLDQPDHAERKSRHGEKKRRVEELIEEEVEELLEGEVEEIIEQAEATAESTSTLGLASSRPKRGGRPAARQHKFNAPTEEIKREVEIGESITVGQLSQKMSVKANDVIKSLMNLDVMASVNQSIDQDTATLVVEEFGHVVKTLLADSVEKDLEEDMALTGEETPRAPVVTVMGHVDHGKTSLLDYIRKTQVVSGEAGGITQHIGAYRVTTDHGEICFIDTPGHAAFTAMRARGAQCTDIVILVVAADDGVMPQTEEAIQHAQGGEVPMVVAINKMDVEGADPERVKNELAARNVIPDDWGGDTQFVQVSAHTGEGINELLEAILLQAEILELRAVVDGPARGVVIESELDRGRGPVATLLVQNGTLKQGDVIVAGQNFGRVRAMTDENGRQVKSAGPATPVEMLGLDGTPGAGDPFLVANDEKRAREVAEFRRDKANDARLATPAASLDNLLDSFGSEETRQLNVVVKADVRGSLEAIVSALQELGNEEVAVNVVFSGVGAIAESDVNYAITAGAVVFGFNVRADSAARKLIENEGIDLRYYKVIYDLVDDVKAALSGMLSPEIREEIVGIAQVKEVFESKKFGNIAGCIVTEGTVYKDKKIRVLRDNIVIYEGELESLRRFKDEVTEVRNGVECGIGVRNYNDVRVGDQIEVFDSREVAREL